MPERPTGRAPRLRAGRGLRSLRPRAQKVVETKVQTCDGAAHKSLRLESFANWADFIEITKRNLGGSPAKLCPRPTRRRSRRCFSTGPERRRLSAAVNGAMQFALPRQEGGAEDPLAEFAQEGLAKQSTHVHSG